MSGEKDPSKDNDNKDGKREINININLAVTHFLPFRTRWTSRRRFPPGGAPPFGINQDGESPRWKPDPDSPDNDDTIPFRYHDDTIPFRPSDFRFEVDEFGEDDHFDEEEGP